MPRPVNVYHPTLETIADVQAWLERLAEVNMLSHPDDDPRTIITNTAGDRLWTDIEADHIEAAYSQAFRITAGTDADIYGMSLDLLHLDDEPAGAPLRRATAAVVLPEHLKNLPKRLTPDGFTDLPLPGDLFDGRIVIASVWGRDDIHVPALGELMLLNAEPPYYTVGQIIRRSWAGAPWELIEGEPRDHFNINHATEDFADSGGDV